MDKEKPSGVSKKRKLSIDRLLTTRDVKRVQSSADKPAIYPHPDNAPATVWTALVIEVPTAFELLPQEIFDEISQWITGADAKNLCLTSKALHKAFAHRKWALVLLEYDWARFDTDTACGIEFLKLLERNEQFGTGDGTTSVASWNHVPAVNYIR